MKIKDKINNWLDEPRVMGPIETTMGSIKEKITNNYIDNAIATGAGIYIAANGLKALGGAIVTLSTYKAIDKAIRKHK